MRWGVKNFFRKSKPADTYRILECVDGRLSASVCTFTGEPKTLKIETLKQRPAPESYADFWRAVFDVQRSLGKRPGKLVFLLSGQQVKTWRTTISALRHDSQAPISETELEDIVAQSLWRVFNRDRGKIAEAFQISELEVATLDARILKTSLDGYRVLSPIGFAAKTVEFSISLTYVPQVALELFRENFAEMDIALIEEASVFWAGLLAEQEKSDFLFAPVFRAETGLVERLGASLKYADSLKWGSQNLFRAIETEFGVDAAVAQSIYALYRKEEMSEPLYKHLTKLLTEELFTVAKAAESNPRLHRGDKVYVAFFTDIPKGLLDRAFSRRRANKTPIVVFNRKILGDLDNFPVQLTTGKDEANFQTILSALALRLDKAEERLAALVRRRARWMH